jgi:hypothetical protein
MKSQKTGKSPVVYFCIVSLLFHAISCSDDGVDQRTFPTEQEVAGHWQLESVYANDQETSFSDYNYQMQNEFYRFSTDHSAHHVVEYEILPQGSNNRWSLSKDTLTVDGLGAFQIKSASADELVLIPETLFGLRLVYKAIDEAEFPEMVFDATVDGDVIKTLNAMARDLGTHFDLRGDGGSFWMAINIPVAAKESDTYDLSVGRPGLGVLLVRNAHEYGYLKRGQITVVKKSDRYIRITSISW